MGNKLSATEADKIVAKAYHDSGNCPTYRMGQALWNLLPRDIADRDFEREDHQKWYQSEDKEYCIQRFYELMVDCS